MNRQAIGKLTEALYISILSELIEENKRYEEAYEEKFFSKEDLEKVASNRTLKIVLSQEKN
tara:strand:+ start:263 stop:445 length:183 start_codon:yes stop_codon:yes gene_type:complete